MGGANFRIGPDFLVKVGLDSLAPALKSAFLSYLYETLELRVGEALSNGLTASQLEEFEAIIERDADVVINWLLQYAPSFQDDEIFLRMQAAMKLPVNDPTLLFEYCATKWLEVNRPDYRDVVREVLADLEGELIANRAAILGSADASSSGPSLGCADMPVDNEGH